MINCVVIIMLIIETVSDIKNKTISGIRIIAFGLLGIVLNFCMVYQSVWSVVGGVIVGAVMLGYAFLSKGAIGIGDGVIFLCLGIYLGLSDNLRLLFYSLIGAALAGGIYALISKKGIKSKIPFIPCVLVAYILMTVVEVVG